VGADATMARLPTAFAVLGRLVGVERVDERLYRVTVDGRHFATFCTESRARAAGRCEARRRELLERSRGRL
jgi:hypothetical protein